MGDWILGLDIGGTKCAVILGRTTDSGVEIVDRRQFLTLTDQGPEQALLRLEETAANILSAHSIARGELRATGVSCGGPLDSVRGIVLGPPNLPGWDSVPITDRFAEKLGAPAYLQNDANACALAEWRWGAGRGSRNMIFLTFGTGLGAGLILDGALYTGTNDLAGEVGHIRLAENGPVGYGKAGSFEGFCSGGGIARLARQVAEERLMAGEECGYCESVDSIPTITTEIVGRAAASGDPVAIEIFARVGRRLGEGLSILIDTLNPEVIVIGSVFARQEALIRPEMERAIEREALSLAASVCTVRPAALGEAIGDYAALSVAAYGAEK